MKRINKARSGNKVKVSKASPVWTEPTVKFANLPVDPNTALSQAWIMENRSAYRGRWVALDGNKLLFAANSAEELIQGIDNPKGKFLTLVY